MLNQQPIEKVVRNDPGDLLDIHSIFHTIQGEGPFCGHPATFVRLAGCNLQCPLCDTEYTEGRRAMNVSEIYSEVRRYGHKQLIVITGGEPLRQPIGKLLRFLSTFYRVQVETNGTLAPPNFGRPPELDLTKTTGVFFVCSPKTGKVNPKLWEAACCAKYVLSWTSVHPGDGLPIQALGHTANPKLARPPVGWDRPIYIQPADVKSEIGNESNRRAVTASALRFGYIVQLQIHKYLGME